MTSVAHGLRWCALFSLSSWLTGASTRPSRLLSTQLDRYFSTTGEPLHPNCNSDYNTPCSVANAYKVVINTKDRLENAAGPTEAWALLHQIHAATYENGADGTGFGPLIINTSDGTILADANGPGLLNKTLEDILKIDSSGCAEDSFLESTCYQAASVIMQPGLLQRLRMAASGDGWTAFLWPDRMEQTGMRSSTPRAPDKKVVFLQEAATPLQSLLVLSTFSDNALFIDDEILPCSASSSALCATEASRQLAGNVLTKMMMVADNWQLERIFYGISFPTTGSTDCAADDGYSLGEFYTFVYRFGGVGEPGEHGECVAHGKKSAFVGKNLSEILSFVGNNVVDGVKVHNLFANAARKGGGWVAYIWKNSASEAPYSKTAYITGTQRFGVKYYIGVGFNSAPLEPTSGPRCEKCLASNSYPCAYSNVLSAVGAIYSLMLTDIPESDAWSLITNHTVPDARYDPTFYAFAFDFNGTCVAHGVDSSLVGMSVGHVFANSSVNASNVHQDFIKAAQLGGRWVSYKFRRPGSTDHNTPKISYIKPVLKYGRSFYVAVGFYMVPWSRNSDGCWADFSAACSEDNTLGIVGSVSSAISAAQSQEVLDAIFYEITNGSSQGSLGSFHRPGGFYVEVYNKEGDCMAHGKHPDLVHQSLNASMFAKGVRRVFRTAQTLRQAMGQKNGWITVPLTMRDGSQKQWRAYTHKVEFAPLDFHMRHWYFVISGFMVGNAPTHCKNGCPLHARCDEKTQQCHCQPGTQSQFLSSGSNCTEWAEDMIMRCDLCPADTYSAESDSVECLPCPPGQSAEQGSSSCAGGTSTLWIVGSTVTGTLLMASAFLLVSLGCCKGLRRFLRRRMRARQDRPDVRESPTGEWVANWIGHVKYKPLIRGDSVVSAQACHTWIVNSSPFDANLYFFSSTDKQGTNFLDAKSTKCLRVEANCFRKSPFEIPRSFYLELSESERDLPEDWSAVVHTNTWSEALKGQVYKFYDDDWSEYPGERDRENFAFRNQGHDEQLKYDGEVARKPLADASRGELRLTLHRDGKKLIIAWSPPHSLRGMPLAELSTFFNDMIGYDAVWTCSTQDGAEVKKAKGCVERNMYDACNHFLRRKVAIYDASYAELHCNIGQANVFISHVWATSAEMSDHAVKKIANRIRSATCRQSALDDRVWFCACCNNQSRVLEELGQKPDSSAFGQVLRSQQCTVFAVIKPFAALRRKWCSYELSFASNLKKRVLMVTPEGIIQHGEVAPRTLCQLTQLVSEFRCKDAECHSRKDSVYIDDAIQELGGYEHLDQLLQIIVKDAVDEAVDWALQAQGEASQLSPHSDNPIKRKSRPVVALQAPASESKNDLSAYCLACAHGAPPEKLPDGYVLGQDCLGHERTGVIVRFPPIHLSCTSEDDMVLYHYTDHSGFAEVTSHTGVKSLRASHEVRVQFGDGIYASQYPPESFTCKEHILLNNYTNSPETDRNLRQIQQWLDKGLADYCVPLILPRDRAVNVSTEKTKEMVHTGHTLLHGPKRKDRDIWVVTMPVDDKTPHVYEDTDYVYSWLASPDCSTRLDAVEILAGLAATGDERATVAVSQSLQNDTDFNVRIAAIWAVVEARSLTASEKIDALTELAQNEKFELVFDALRHALTVIEECSTANEEAFQVMAAREKSAKVLRAHETNAPHMVLDLHVPQT